MKISKRAEYGLAAMVHLARGKKNKAVSIREISNMEGAPFAFLSKIFMDLEKGKLVSASYGANGGYILAVKPEKISVMDIVKLLENMNSVNCGACGKSKKCLTKSIWGRVDGAVNKTLESIKLSDLIA